MDPITSLDHPMDALIYHANGIPWEKAGEHLIKHDSGEKWQRPSSS